MTALVCAPSAAHGARAPAHPAAGRDAGAEVLGDLARLAQARPRPCPDQDAAGSGPLGWSGGAVQCAWQNRLRMRRWEAPAEAAPGCLSQPARWWAWARARGARPEAPAAWHSGWSGQSFADGGADADGALRRIGVIERAADGGWRATEWSWQPSPRAATRQWQQGRWNLLLEAAHRRRQPERAELAGQEVAPLRAAWEKQLDGRAGELAAQAWSWQRDGVCLKMETANLAQAQLHLPYAREDSRLEQRAAMQVQLARTYPKASWLAPLRLLAPPTPAPRGGAKYTAIWTQSGAVRGQLWMPRPDGGIVRARIVVALAPKAGALDAAAAGRLVDLELTGLAAAWERDHER